MSPDSWTPLARTPCGWCGRNPGGGEPFGNARRRYLLGWLVARPRVPAGFPWAAVAAVASLELLGDKPAAVFRDGRRVPLALRRAEILALLDSSAQGWTAEELAYELYGDAGTPQAIRTEMFRIRSIPVDAVESNPYRFVPGLAGRSDSRQVLRLLREGRVPDALELYSAPLLSRSGALAVQLLRDQLDLAVGLAVRSRGDTGLLVRWLSTGLGAQILRASKH